MQVIKHWIPGCYRLAARRVVFFALSTLVLTAILPLNGQVLPPAMASAGQVNKIGVYRGQTGAQAVWLVNSSGDHQTTGQTMYLVWGATRPCSAIGTVMGN